MTSPLDKERANLDFNQAKFTEYLHGGKEAFQKFQKDTKRIMEDPAIKTHPTSFDMGREEMFAEQYKRFYRFMQLKEDDFEPANIVYYLQMT